MSMSGPLFSNCHSSIAGLLPYTGTGKYPAPCRCARSCVTGSALRDPGLTPFASFAIENFVTAVNLLIFAVAARAKGGDLRLWNEGFHFSFSFALFASLLSFSLLDQPCRAD